MTDPETSYVVSGRGPFPVDMLRRDGSRASTPEDQAKIDKLADGYASELVEISLVGPRWPNTERWKSFGWLAVRVEGYDGRPGRVRGFTEELEPPRNSALAAQQLYEAYVRGMGQAGVGIEESWDVLDEADRSGWNAVAAQAQELSRDTERGWPAGSGEGKSSRFSGEALTLARAIAGAAQRAGIYNGEVPLTGPMLLLLLDDLAGHGDQGLAERAVAHREQPPR
jgi:hypothetical protein